MMRTPHRTAGHRLTVSTIDRPKTCTARVRLMALVALILLSACRGSDDEPADPRFPRTADPDAFLAFLNQSPAVPREGVNGDEIDNVADFAEAYYNTIDPDATRDTFLKWRIANGFLNQDGTEAVCEPSNCITTHVKFRDTKDLGYGRNMFMRRDLLTGDVAVYVENFQVDVVPGVPYGALNFEALVRGDRSWNFGVNAIEFSAFPQTGAGALKYTKFYNYSGDGKRARPPSGSQQHFVDLDDRGDKSMPTPCIICHGGQGRTLVYGDANAKLKLAPTITGGIPGDVQAQLQIIEIDTLQFADEATGFTEADNADGIRLINDAVLSTYRYRQENFSRPGDWDATFAIETLEGRYAGNPGNAANAYDERFVPGEWQSRNPGLYRNPVGPNCMVCHALRGSQLNDSISFADYDDFIAYGERSHDLVFEQGKMPLGLLNYADLWDSGKRRPEDLAALFGKPVSLDTRQRAVPPGQPVAVIALPPVASGVNLAAGTVFDIPVSGNDSAFAEPAGFVWSVEPAATASIGPGSVPGQALLRASAPGQYTVTLSVTGARGSTSTAQASIEVRDLATDDTLPPPESIRYYGAGGIDAMIQTNTCLNCHVPGTGNDGIPLYFTACRSEVIDGYDFLYRSVLARVNFDTPLDSLLLRKSHGGATDLNDPIGSGMPGYHQGGPVLAPEPAETGRLLAWILSGAPRGDLPNEPIDATAAACLP